MHVPFTTEVECKMASLGAELDRLWKSDRATNRNVAPCAGWVSAAGLAPTSGAIITQIQLHSSRADSAVRVRYAQPGSPVSTGQLRPLWPALAAHRPASVSARRFHFAKPGLDRDMGARPPSSVWCASIHFQSSSLEANRWVHTERLGGLHSLAPARLPAKFVEQVPRPPQIVRAEAVRKPIGDRGQQLNGLLSVTPLCPEAGEAGRRTSQDFACCRRATSCCQANQRGTKV
jgi:hypothetical protein